MVRLDTFLQELERAQGLEHIQSLIVSLQEHYAVDHIVYHWVSADGEQYGCGTYDPVWVQRYVDKDYLRIDPVVISCFHKFHPVDWKQLDWSSKPARAFLADAVAHGVGNQGYSIPIRGPNGQFALFSVSHNCVDDVWEKFIQNNQRELFLIAHYLNQKALSMEQKRNPEPSTPLSPREVDALTFLAMGYSRSQVADMLQISEHTLRAYIESARLKLHAMNTTHAVARALAEGLIVVGGSARGAAGTWPGRSQPQARGASAAR
jgi:DNA-binding CsgD family transcriptional regulator